MRKPLILYSTATWLAYVIAERYYRGIHYAWCTPCFAPDSPWSHGGTMPPTSCPSVIYHSLWEEVQGGDRHSSKIKENKTGILNGALSKEQTGAITPVQREEITAVVEGAEIQDFRPLVLVIPFGRVARLVREVAVRDRAHPLSIEYVIENLPRDRFDVIELRRR